MYSYKTLIVNFAPTNPIRSKLEQTIKNRVEDVGASVDQWIQGIRKEMDEKTEEKQRDLQKVKKSLDMRTKGLLGDRQIQGRTFMISSAS
jgi:hypothetical protein